MQHPAIHAVWRGCQTNNPQLGIANLELLKKPLVHRVGIARDEMRFVHDHEVYLLKQHSLSMYRLNAAERNRVLVLTLANASRVDACRGIGPQHLHLVVVLLNQLHDMRDDDDLHLAILSHRTSAYFR